MRVSCKAQKPRSAFFTSGSRRLFSSVMRVKKILEWKLECNEVLRKMLEGAGDSRESRHERVVNMSTGATHAEALATAAFPPGLDAYWETVNQTVWNERENTSEKCELVYEISWISELGTWRRFLRSQRKLRG
jgi:hypothetical protein